MIYKIKYILKFIFYNVDSCKIFVKYVITNKNRNIFLMVMSII
jgi:hypothetical protein